VAAKQEYTWRETEKLYRSTITAGTTASATTKNDTTHVECHAKAQGQKHKRVVQVTVIASYGAFTHTAYFRAVASADPVALGVSRIGGEVRVAPTLLFRQ